MPNLEPASALAERIENACIGYSTAREATIAKLIEADRAAVREPLERRIAELRRTVDVVTERAEVAESALEQEKDHHAEQLAEAEYQGELDRERIASLEAQLASAREEALREAIAAANACQRSGTAELTEYDRAVDLVLAKLEALLTSLPKSPWIPVEERLPEPGVEVLGWHKFGDHAHRISWRVDGDGAYWWDEEHDEYLEADEDGGPWISHWQPALPPPAAQKEPL